MGTYEFWTDAAAGPQSRAERGFVVSLLVDELNQVFLDREPGFSLTAASTWLVAALDAGSAALTRVPKNSGLFNFQVLNAKDFAADLDNQLTFLRTSLSTAGPRGFPHSPDYLLSLKTLVDSPIDIQSLHQASPSGAGVFLFHDGVPGALPAAGRNDWWELDTAAATKALVPVFALPPDQSATSCSDLSPCPGRYFCQPDAVGLLSHCQTPGFLFLDKATLKRALPSTGDPAFLDMDALRPLRMLQ